MPQRTKLALRLESVISARAKANQVAGGGDQKSGSQKSDNPINRVDTKSEIAKIAGVSHDTVATRSGPSGAIERLLGGSGLETNLSVT